MRTCSSSESFDCPYVASRRSHAGRYTTLRGAAVRRGTRSRRRALDFRRECVMECQRNTWARRGGVIEGRGGATPCSWARVCGVSRCRVTECRGHVSRAVSCGRARRVGRGRGARGARRPAPHAQGAVRRPSSCKWWKCLSELNKYRSRYDTAKFASSLPVHSGHAFVSEKPMASKGSRSPSAKRRTTSLSAGSAIETSKSWSRCSRIQSGQ